MQKLFKTIAPIADYGLYAAFTLALLSMLTSLYFSEVVHLVPCQLCWWGRIMMYPLVAIIGTSILRRDNAAGYYAAPLVGLGILIAGYHSLLQWKIIPEGIIPCSASVSCANVTWQLFGFVTIPFLEFLTFIAIGVSLYVYHATRTRA